MLFVSSFCDTLLCVRKNKANKNPKTWKTSTKEASSFKEIPRRSEFISAISHLLISISQCGPQANKHKSSTTDEFHSSDFNSKRQFTAVKHFILTKNKIMKTNFISAFTNCKKH